MKYLIPIDRSSIKRNEHYPHLCRYEIYPRELTRVDTYKGYGIEANGDTKWVLVSQEILESTPQYEYVDMLGPAPKYFYSYADTMVQCSWCFKKFDHTTLDSDWHPETNFNSCEGEERFIYTCPLCQTPNCCELEFEELSQEILEGICLQRAK